MIINKKKTKDIKFAKLLVFKKIKIDGQIKLKECYILF